MSLATGQQSYQQILAAASLESVPEAHHSPATPQLNLAVSTFSLAVRCPFFAACVAGWVKDHSAGSCGWQNYLSSMHH